MTATFAIFAFILGAVLGSFFNVVGLRVPKGESIISPPSHCPNCGRWLTAGDLIPVVSYFFFTREMSVMPEQNLFHLSAC